MFLGADIVLTAEEEEVNAILMKIKEKEYRKGFNDPASFPPARHFFEVKEDIERSEVFRIIQLLPKGACLHGHDTAMVSSEFVLKNLTYMPDLYTCEDAEGVTLLRFFELPDQSCDWQLLSDLRFNATNVTALDEELERHLSLFTSNPREAYPDVNTVWKVFEKITKTVNGLVYYKPAFERYFYQLLKEFHEDNIMYAELRSEVSGVFELNGTLLPETAVATIMKDITQRFISDHPDFWGIKIIYTSFRRLELSEVEQYIANALTLKEEHPDLIAGFDIIGQEDLGKPLKDFADLLLTVKDDIKFFFHAGETDWEGITDLNLVDAVLLNATRIGHGYAILKHPLVLETVKRLGIPIEVNPISNQVLLLVADLRNHPAATLIAENYHVVISSDDPGFWGAKGLSYDIYEAFMGLAGLEADLRVLKQLALNSLRYSALDEETKEDIISAWEQTWTLFLNAVLNMTRH
ncbi:adenosine deaminase 2-like isoform X2 [Periplaneta americana]